MTEPRMIPSTDGVEVALHDLGGTGPTLLLAHATGFHGLVWVPVAAHLRDFHCLAPDLRGHGDTVRPVGLAMDWNGFADDVLAIADALGTDDLRGAGHSKGGAALLLAEERHPGTFRSLYLFEPIVFPTIPTTVAGTNPLSDGARRRRSSFPSFDAAYENFAGKAPLNVLHPEALRAYVNDGFALQPDGTVELKCRPDTEAEVYAMGSQHDAFAHLADVHCPTVVATGIDIPMTPSSFAAPIVAALPDARLERHTEVGHFGPLEDPAGIAACIRKALSD